MSGTLLVSLDFELFWGMLDCCPLSEYQDHVLGGRRAIPMLLRLFRERGIHATWATVGFMFADNKEELKKYFPEETLRPSYENPKLSPYARMDTIGQDEIQAPCFFAPTLIRLIADTPGQEIGSHTFCHYYCREKGQTPAQVRADLCAAKDIALDHGYDLTSVILPRNQCEPEYTAVLRDLGFNAYRDEENDWIHNKIHWRPLKRALRLMDVYFPLTGLGGYRPKNEEGIWNLTGSRMFKPIFVPLRFMEKIKLARIKSQMRHAAKHNLTFHLWWHPHNIGVFTEEHFQQLEEIFDYFAVLQDKYGMESLNMAEMAQRLDRKA